MENADDDKALRLLLQIIPATSPIKPTAQVRNASASVGNSGNVTNSKRMPTIGITSPERNVPGWTVIQNIGTNTGMPIQIMLNEIGSNNVTERNQRRN